MQEVQDWWRRPQVLAACGCVLVGVALLIGGPLLGQAFDQPALQEPEPSLFDEPLLSEAAEAPPLPVLELEPIPAELIIYISGAVAQPDVYRLPADARVKDAVVAAGGLRADAASERINLAERLSDAQHIHIPHQNEEVAAPEQSASADAPAGTVDGLLDLNRASAAELEELPGIGATIAERIIAYREQEGPFGSVEELRQVTGIGEKLFAQISPLIIVSS